MQTRPIETVDEARVKSNSMASTIRNVWERIGDAVLVVGLFAVSLVLYIQTLAPSVATLFDDSLEFPLAAYTLAVAHPTGYPFYTLLGNLFTRGPWSTPAYGVNLISAVCGALTVALVYLIAREWTRRRLTAALGAVALAASPVFWSQAVVAEVYTPNSAFVAAMLWLTLRWARKPLSPVEPITLLLYVPAPPGALFLPGESPWLRLPVWVRRTAHRVHSLYRRLFPPVPIKQRLRLHSGIYLLAAVYGLSLTHHRTMVLLAPALLVFALLVQRRVFSRAALLGPEHPYRSRWLRLAGRPIVLLVVCFFVPLLLYLYLPVRGHVGSLDGSYSNTWSGFWQWVSASGYSAFLSDNPLARDLDAAFYAGLFWNQFGPVGIALAALGLIGLARWRKPLILLTLAFLTYVAFAVVYQVPDVEVFFIPAFLILAIWIGVGIDYSVEILRPRGPSMAIRRMLWVCLAVTLFAATLQPLLVLVRTYPIVDLGQRWIVHDYGQYVLDEPLPQDSTIVGLLGEMTLLRYFQRTADLRPDVATVAADDEQERRQAIDDAFSAGGAVFITRPLPGLTQAYALNSVIGLIDVSGDLETLIRVGEPNFEEPTAPRPVHVEVVPGLQLLGYGTREHHGHWQGWTRLRLWWQAPQGLEERLKFSSRLLNNRGQAVASVDGEPVAGAYPTTDWRAGEIVADAHEIPLPIGLPPGDYVPVVIVYDPATGAERGRIELAPIHLQGSPIRPPRHELVVRMERTPHARFGDLELLGVTPPDPQVDFSPGDSLNLVLVWQAVDEPAADIQVRFWLEAGEQVLLGREPVAGSYPVSQWQAQQVVGQWLALPVPAGIAPDTYQLKLRVERDGHPIPWGRGWIPMGSDLALGTILIGP